MRSWPATGVLCFDLQDRWLARLPADRRSRLVGGVAALLTGIVISAVAPVATADSDGTPLWVGLAAAAVFAIAGLALLAGAGGG